MVLAIFPFGNPPNVSASAKYVSNDTKFGSVKLGYWREKDNKKKIDSDSFVPWCPRQKNLSRFFILLCTSHDNSIIRIISLEARLASNFDQMVHVIIFPFKRF
jgi:hypothetical protein